MLGGTKGGSSFSICVAQALRIKDMSVSPVISQQSIMLSYMSLDNRMDVWTSKDLAVMAIMFILVSFSVSYDTKRYTKILINTHTPNNTDWDIKMLQRNEEQKRVLMLIPKDDYARLTKLQAETGMSMVMIIKVIIRYALNAGIEQKFREMINAK